MVEHSFECCALASFIRAVDDFNMLLK